MPKGGLSRWFQENWVDLSRPKKGGGFEPCGRPDAATGKYPKCVPAARAAQMTQEEIQSAIRRKRLAESTQQREGKKPIMVPTVKKATMNIPNDMELYNKVKAEAKAKFDVYPSAYANGWMVQEYKRRGGTYRSMAKGDPGVSDVHVPTIMGQKRRKARGLTLMKHQKGGHNQQKHAGTNAVGPGTSGKAKTKAEKSKEVKALSDDEYARYAKAPKNFDHDEAIAYAKGKTAAQIRSERPTPPPPPNRYATADQCAQGFRPLTPGDEKKFMADKQSLPPAWTEVQISIDPKGVNGCIVRGKDVKGRIQSLYSAEHTANQAAKKFERIKQLEKDVSKLDTALAKDAAKNDDAAAVLLMRELGMRPGSRKNTQAAAQAYGATTLEVRHVRINKGSVTFDFTGKKGVGIKLNTKDPQIRKVVESRMKGKGPNEPLFRTSEARANLYIKSKMGRGYTNKDLRTLKATTMALDIIKRTKPPRTLAEFKKMRNAVGDMVASQLGNTRTLALSSYINPVVFAMWEANL